MINITIDKHIYDQYTHDEKHIIDEYIARKKAQLELELSQSMSDLLVYGMAVFSDGETLTIKDFIKK